MRLWCHLSTDILDPKNECRHRLLDILDPENEVTLKYFSTVVLCHGCEDFQIFFWTEFSSFLG